MDTENPIRDPLGWCLAGITVLYFLFPSVCFMIFSGILAFFLLFWLIAVLTY
jgi:hypothetical protein